ncbi:hypothetical protein [Streptomyces sp. NBC_00344]|uniref:hypothetical protein n=1 Tax=Streptomyces sp. NBC_00344 TaxID=2975720 RepID=UPI003FA6B9ED
MFQLLALILVSAFLTFFTSWREQRGRELTQVRSVATAAQDAMLKPLPHRIGPLRIASVYLAAESEAKIGGDLYAAVRTAQGTRVIIVHVRGKALKSGRCGRPASRRVPECGPQAGGPFELIALLEGTVSPDLDDPAAPEEKSENRG